MNYLVLSTFYHIFITLFCESILLTLQLRHLKYSSQCLDCKCLANFSFLNIFSQVVHLTQKLAAFNECFFFRCLLKLCSWLYIVEHFGQPNLPLLSVLTSFSPDFADSGCAPPVASLSSSRFCGVSLASTSSQSSEMDSSLPDSPEL